MTVGSKESVLSRWSRRKLETKRQADEGAPKSVTEVADEAQAPVANPAEPTVENEKPALTDADMPDIDSLDENSDFTPFMSSGVSDELRNLALRKLFRARVFNIRDGLDEYDDDFTSFEKLGDIVTCDMKHRIEMEQQKLREALAEEESQAGEKQLEDEAQQAAGDAQDDTGDIAQDDTGKEDGELRIAQAGPATDAEAEDDER